LPFGAAGASACEQPPTTTSVRRGTNPGGKPKARASPEGLVSFIQLLPKINP